MYIADDGTWHYTQDGADYVLTDDAGNSITAWPVDGKNGVTPQISVDAEGYWQVSMDGGATLGTYWRNYSYSKSGHDVT